MRRPEPGVRIRGSQGQKLRKRRLARTDGLCELCLAEGIVRLATIVDHHPVPLAHGGLDVDENTRNICDEHNREVTAEQFKLERSKSLGGSNAAGLPLDPKHPWNQMT